METDCKELNNSSSQGRIVNPHKSKYRKRQDSSPESRGGSPYSSDSLSSSSFFDGSASTTRKDSYFNETNETSSSSFEVGSDKEMISPWSTANFDRVLHDAPKREHIRSRKSAGSRANQGGKGGVGQSDSGPNICLSRSKPAMRSKLHGRTTLEMTIGDSENSTSSESMESLLFNQGKDSFKGMDEKNATSNGTDTGIATSNTSSQSVQSLSSISTLSSSGVDTRQSLYKDRKNLPGKSVSSHYHNIRKVSKDDHSENLSECSNSSTAKQHQHHFHHSEEEQNYMIDTVSSMESERKRRRFNRTFVLLRHCGLLELTLQTASLMQQSSLMNQQLKSLRQQTGVLYNAIHGLSTSQSSQSQSFDSTMANGILKNLQDIITRHDSAAYTSQHTSASQHTHRLAVKRTSSGETISPDSGNAQSSSALQNSGSST